MIADNINPEIKEVITEIKNKLPRNAGNYYDVGGNLKFSISRHEQQLQLKLDDDEYKIFEDRIVFNNAETSLLLPLDACHILKEEIRDIIDNTTLYTHARPQNIGLAEAQNLSQSHLKQSKKNPPIR